MLAKYKPKVCEYCQKEYYKDPDETIESWVKRRFCSRKCNDICRRRVPKCSTTKVCQCGKEFHKTYEMAWARWATRKFCSPECTHKYANYKAPSTAFKKGLIPWNYKEEGYGYAAIHQWLNRHYKKTGVCEQCGSQTKTSWANVSGQYLRDIKNFKELCDSCHTKLDKKEPKNPRYTGGPVSNT